MIGLDYILKLWDMQQDELAKRLGIKKQNINYWVTGKRNIPKKYLPKLVEMFKLKEDYFQKELTDIEEFEIHKIKIQDKYAKLGNWNSILETFNFRIEGR